VLGILILISTTVIKFTTDTYQSYPLQYHIDQTWMFPVMIYLSIATAVAFLSLNTKYIEIENEAAQAEIKVLSGLIPICSICKKMRDDKGQWYRLEDYLLGHSEALLTHGYCPECFDKEMIKVKNFKT
jgi:hypothetical protein